MARANRDEEREIRTSVAEGEPMSREQLAGWIMQWITGNDPAGYARAAAARYEALRQTPEMREGGYEQTCV